MSAYRVPGSRWLGAALVLPLAMPSYILGFLVLSTVGLAPTRVENYHLVAELQLQGGDDAAAFRKMVLG